MFFFVPGFPSQMNLQGTGTFGTPSKPETFETVRTHQKPSKPGTPKPSKPGTTFGTRNLSKPIETYRNMEPPSVPGTRFLPGTAPARPEHTEIYIVQRPHSILLLGKNDEKNKHHLITSPTKRTTSPFGRHGSFRLLYIYISRITTKKYPPDSIFSSKKSPQR